MEGAEVKQSDSDSGKPRLVAWAMLMPLLSLVASCTQALEELFLKDLYRLYSLPPESLLVAHLQAGLSALKTPLCFQVGSRVLLLLMSVPLFGVGSPPLHTHPDRAAGVQQRGPTAPGGLPAACPGAALRQACALQAHLLRWARVQSGHAGCAAAI